MAGKLIVYGISGFGIGATVKIFFNGVQLGSIKSGGREEFNISRGGSLTAKCGINPSKGELWIEDGMYTEARCTYSRLTGSINIEKVCSRKISSDDTVQADVEQPVYDLVGCRGRSMKVFKDRVIIKTSVTVGSLLTSNATDGEKTIYYADCIGVQFKESRMAIGYVQLETASSSMNNRNNNFFNENSFTFEDSPALTNWKMKEVADYIQKQIRECKKPQPTVVAAPAVSAADELKKFKELLDIGIITQEEFDAKKKQLLGL